MSIEVNRSSNSNTMKSRILLFILLSIFSLLQAQQFSESTGDFDIKKVREAVFSQSDTSLSEKVQSAKNDENYFFVILRVTLYLLIVIGGIFAVAWVVKKSGLSGTSRIGGTGAMDVLEILPFGQNRTVTMVRVMDAVYLLGQTPHSIVLLEKIEGQKAIDLIASSKGGSSIIQFKDAFNNFISKMKKPG
ncbi:MAG TPA: flagellar biosynthetic protein FliO [Chitinispirillaceae bacterium]|nr:flagellar biosynthetic protein FliO [Chitinispirillaceae bacterium]